jgi:methionine sulfoxide reductase heme-binding subunit
MSAASAFSSAPLWYTTRSTAVIAFVLLTFSMMLGLASTQRALASPSWPRFATQALHRNMSLLALGFVVAHIITTVADSFVKVGWWASIVPGISHYKTAWVTLGTIAFDTMLVVITTSLLRNRLPLHFWRGIHFAVYALWPLVFVHFLKTGSDASHWQWGLWLDVVAAVLIALVVVARWRTRGQAARPADRPARRLMRAIR